MKRIIMASTLALTVAFAGAAFAQEATTSTTTTTRTVELTPDQRTVFHDYVVKDTRPSFAVQGFEVRTGAVLPPNVTFYDVPNVQRYRYSYVNNHRVIVDPQTREVVEVIQ
jgi:hypothetical protein